MPKNNVGFFNFEFFPSKILQTFFPWRVADSIRKIPFKKEHLPQSLSFWFHWLRKSELSCYLSGGNRMGQSSRQHLPDDLKSKKKNHIKKYHIIKTRRNNPNLYYREYLHAVLFEPLFWVNRRVRVVCYRLQRHQNQHRTLVLVILDQYQRYRLLVIERNV